MKPIVQNPLIGLLLLSLAVGCIRPNRHIQVVRADAARVTQPNVPAQELAELVRGNNDFAVDLYRALREQESGNFFYSPFSISIALAMTWAGARGETEREMADVLHFTLPQDRLHPAFNALDLELARRGQGARGKDSKGFRLHIVNALWSQKGYQFLPECLPAQSVRLGGRVRHRGRRLDSSHRRRDRPSPRPGDDREPTVHLPHPRPADRRHSVRRTGGQSSA